MKVWMIAVISTVLGVSAGLGNVWLEFGAVDTKFDANRPYRDASSDPTVGSNIARAVVPEAEFDFGAGQRNSKMTHTFLIRNEGRGPLTLEKGVTTCKCTLSNLEDGEVLPGEAAEVVLDWKLTTMGEDFRQSAEIRTNDPRHETVTLVIYGKIVDRVKIKPSDIVLTSVSASEGAETQFRLFGYEDDAIEVTSWSFGEQETKEFFDLTVEDADSETLADEENATCGVTANLVVKPGLPLGPINQTIRLVTNIEELGTLEVSVVGSVVSDISIFGGADYSQKLSVLKLGTIDAGTGKEMALRILIKGPHRHDTEFEIQKVDPDDALDVSITEPKPINDGAVYMRTLKVKVREDSRPVNRLGADQSEFGKIILETTHPDVKTIPIYVKFSVR